MDFLLSGKWRVLLLPPNPDDAVCQSDRNGGALRSGGQGFETHGIGVFLGKEGRISDSGVTAVLRHILCRSDALELLVVPTDRVFLLKEFPPHRSVVALSEPF